MYMYIYIYIYTHTKIMKMCWFDSLNIPKQFETCVSN